MWHQCLQHVGKLVRIIEIGSYIIALFCAVFFMRSVVSAQQAGNVWYVRHTSISWVALHIWQ